MITKKKVSESVSLNFGTEKSLGIGLEKFWYRKKVSESVSFRFWVSSHTVHKPVSHQLHLAPRRADLEQVFAGANFNTEKVSGAHVEVSGAHFKVLSIIKSLRSTFESLLKVSGAQFNEKRHQRCM